MGKRLVLHNYWRDKSLDINKFQSLDELLEAVIAKGELGPVPTTSLDGISVDSPEMLGDTYEEIIENMNRIGAAGLIVFINKPKPRRRIG